MPNLGKDLWLLHLPWQSTTVTNQHSPSMSRATTRRNVHFLDGENNEILGFWQNGSVSWSQIAEWMYITITLPSVQYAVFRCLESGNPENPATNHGPSINLSGNNNAVHSGYYVVLSVNGEYRNSDLLLNLCYERGSGCLESASRTPHITRIQS
jgi:hypothetical protein